MVLKSQAMPQLNKKLNMQGIKFYTLIECKKTNKNKDQLKGLSNKSRL